MVRRALGLACAVRNKMVRYHFKDRYQSGYEVRKHWLLSATLPIHPDLAELSVNRYNL